MSDVNLSADTHGGWTMPKPTKDKHSSFVAAKDRPTVDVVDYGYQPSKTELAKDLRLEGALERAAQALVQPVNIRRITRPR